jgi:CRP/FNR family cyclic AMP-dependent transcriptional regulator
MVQNQRNLQVEILSDHPVVAQLPVSIISVCEAALLTNSLDEEASIALRASIVEIGFTRSQVVFAERDPGDRPYVILNGKIKLGTTSNDGRESLLSVLGPWLTGRPVVGEALLKALAQRLKRTNENLSDLVFSDAPGRVAKALVGIK